MTSQEYIEELLKKKSKSLSFKDTSSPESISKPDSFDIKKLEHEEKKLESQLETKRAEIERKKLEIESLKTNEELLIQLSNEEKKKNKEILKESKKKLIDEIFTKSKISQISSQIEEINYIIDIQPRIKFPIDKTPKKEQKIIISNLLDIANIQINEITKKNKDEIKIIIKLILESWPILSKTLTEEIRKNLIYSNRPYILVLAHFLTECGILSDQAASIILIALAGFNLSQKPGQLNENEYKILLETIKHSSKTLFEKIIKETLKLFNKWISDNKQVMPMMIYKIDTEKISICYSNIDEITEKTISFIFVDNCEKN